MTSRPAASVGVELVIVTKDELRLLVREEVARMRTEEELTVAEVARLRKVTPATVRDWIRGGLQASGGRYKRIKRVDLDAWVHRDKSAAHLRLLGGRR